jgi:hypothetical protein
MIFMPILQMTDSFLPMTDDILLMTDDFYAHFTDDR